MYTNTHRKVYIRGTSENCFDPYDQSPRCYVMIPAGEDKHYAGNKPLGCSGQWFDNCYTHTVRGLRKPQKF